MATLSTKHALVLAAGVVLVLIAGTAAALEWWAVSLTASALLVLLTLTVLLVRDAPRSVVRGGVVQGGVVRGSGADGSAERLDQLSGQITSGLADTRAEILALRSELAAVRATTPAPSPSTTVIPENAAPSS